MVSLRFPVRLSSAAFYADRKLFANGFLLAMAPMALFSQWRFFHTGNSEIKVSLLVVAHTVLLTDRKLFAYGFLFGLAPMAFLTHRKLFDRKLSIHYIFTDCE